jgi:Sec-independent protein translocase protein TatA|tara:strand:- start:2437 stop:2781 length:345 start_codon:yes stop_codon:yes gene_type:complete
MEFDDLLQCENYCDILIKIIKEEGKYEFTMLGVQEIIILLILPILFFILSSRKLPELARSLGRARKDFDDGFEEDSVRIRKISQNLGIPIEGKSDEQLLKELEAMGKISIDSEP